MKKRFLSLMLALCMMLTILPTAAFASESASGTCGENLTWELNNGTLTISGTGAMEDYSWSNSPPWDSYADSITKVIIPDSVTSIGDTTFSGCSNLTSVTIGDRVTSIGDSAFENCSSLTSVDIPDSVTSIEYDAFLGCSGLTSVTIGNNVTSIGSEAFYDCSNLTSVIIPDSVTSIGAWAFEDCSGLTSVTIGKGLASTGYGVFSGCSNLASVYISNLAAWCKISFSSWASNPMCYADKLYLNNELLTSVTIPDSITSIGDYTFYGCSSLNSVVIPDSVTSIGSLAFENCSSLTSVDIPDSVTSIGSSAFYGCSKLNTVVIPDSVTSIEYAAFSACSSLTSVTIPASVTYIDSYVFAQCDALTAIKVDSANTQFCSENGILFNKDKTEIICYPVGKSGAYTIPGGVTAIGEGAFDHCDDLTSVTFTNSVTGIAYGAFYGCNNLADVALPASLTSIGSYAFYSYADDRKLKNAYFNGNAPDVGSSIFPADTTLHYIEGTTGWTDSEYYDADAGTWHGYKLATVGGSSNVSGTVKGVYGSKFTYSDRSFFTGSSSTTYNHELAIASCNLAIAAFNASGAEGENYTEASAAENVRELLARLGFSAAQVETGTYAGKPSTNSIAAAIASKEINNGDEAWTLLTVAVRGGGYEAEWGGNFNVGSSGAHEGFDMAAGKVCQAVMDYVETHNVGGKVAVWITGYSRGAAVANRVASALSGGYLGEVGCYVNANDVYAYTFETPMASLNTDSVARKNIFNIVNATDIVAKVAPSAWGFGRYGTDVVFPTAEMSSSFGSSFGSYLADAETYYTDFTDGDVLPKNFKAYKLDYQNGVIKMVEDTNSFRRYHSFFVDEFVNDSICGELFTSRSDYADSWEEVVVEAATSLNAAGLNLEGLTTAGLEELADEIAQYILDYLKEQGLIKVFTKEVAKKILFAFDLIDTLNGEKKKEFFEGFSHILVSAGVLTVSEEAAADMLDDAITLKSMKQLLEFLLKNFEEIYTLVKNLAWVEVAHEPQFCLAWLLSTPEMMMKESQKTYRIIGVNCPVDVRVYDSNGVLVAAIINDQVQEIEGSTVSAIIDENGQKLILLPADEEYRVETTATADGTMSYSVTEYDAALGEKTRVINYYDMVLDEGTKYTGTVENLAVESAQYPLQTESGNVVPVSEELRGEEISSYVVTVTAEANGYVSGGGAFTCGEYAKVSATADEGAEFRGWYSDGELVSEDAEYRFRVSKDIELTAKFDTGVVRIFGADRYETAFKTAEVLKQQLGVEKFDNIVVACGDNFADALGGSYLAAKKGAPILLVKSSKIDAVKSYIKANLNPGGTVYLLGGTAAIPAAMDTGLDGFTVRRLAGATRYDTNLLILEEAGVTNEDILICTGKSFADSLSAAAAGRPLLLVKDSLNDSQKAFLQSHAANKKYILGGTAAVSTSVENQAKAYGTVKRIGGNTRYETSVLIAQEFFPNAKQAALAYAQNFPDGLSGGALAYAMKAPLVLTASGKEAAAAAYAKEQGIGSGVIFGGNGLISDKAVRTIFQMQSGDVIKIG